MEVIRVDDAKRFLALAGSFARQEEGRNQLVLGIAANAAAERTGFVPFRAWIVVDGDVRARGRSDATAQPGHGGPRVR